MLWPRGPRRAEHVLQEDRLPVRPGQRHPPVRVLVPRAGLVLHPPLADGVHEGQSDMEAGDVREKLGPDKIIGVSAQTVEQAKLAEAHGADYLGVGAVFATGSKDDAVEVGPQALRDICQAVSIPVIAIGGISKDNVSQLAGSGICGIAVISAIFAQKDVKAASKELHDLTAEMVAASAEDLQE